MDIKSQIDMFIDDTFTDIEDNDFDFNLDNVEVEYVEANQHGITDYSLDGDPTIDEYDIVYIKRDVLETKLLEFVEAQDKKPSMGAIHDAVAKVLGNKLVVESVNDVPTQMSTSAITREITIAINEEMGDV